MEGVCGGWRGGGGGVGVGCGGVVVVTLLCGGVCLFVWSTGELEWKASSGSMGGGIILC